VVLCTTIAWLATEALLDDSHSKGGLDPAQLVSIQIRDRRDVLLRDRLSRPEGRSRWVTLDQVPQDAVDALIASEDQRFFSHEGLDWLAAARAVAQNLAAGRIVSGASTISMQVARVVEPNGRSLRSKLRQVALALALEARLTKRGILTEYFNRAPYGNGAIGIEAAAWRYFDKPASQLSLAQTALLVAIPRAPAAYNPLRADGLSRLRRRQRYILHLMHRQGRIGGEGLRLALAEPPRFEPTARPFSAPHFVQRVLAAREAQGAVELRTTIDLVLQKRAELAVARTVRELKDRGVTSAAVVVVENKTGDVLAYVGSPDFGDERRAGQVDGVAALRQPGSTIKALTYALALEQAYTPATIIPDLPVHFTTDQGDYHPRNYSDQFHGPVRLRVALASSYNVPAVRVLADLGVERLLDRLHALGFESLDQRANYYGLGLTLGNGEVQLWELVRAYATFARGGVYRELRTVLATRDLAGRWRNALPAKARRSFDRRTSYLISDILGDPMARLPAFGRDGPLDLPFPAAVKTGTSKDYRDNWTVGYTPEITVGAWVGNFDGSSMHGVSGITGAGPLWAEVMTASMADRPKRAFSRPPGLVTVKICPLSGQPVGEHCEHSIEELFLHEKQPQGTCAYHQLLALDRRNGLLAGDACAAPDVRRERHVVYPPRFETWAAQNGLIHYPRKYSPACAPRQTARLVRIAAPVTGDRYYLDPDLPRRYQSIALEAAVHGAAKAVRWVVDGRQVALVGPPYRASWQIEPGRHTIVAELPDGVRSSPIDITVR
jgi:penicillin-binding protein 1C